MNISVQYLEGGGPSSRVSPRAARMRLRHALERVPFIAVLLGWDLNPRVVEACAEECVQHRCKLYLWQPVLTGHASFAGDPGWRVVGLNGGPVLGLDGKAEFTFLCPNRSTVLESVLQTLDDALQSGCYEGVFLDRIRFPSPAADVASHLACFCDACRLAAQERGLGLSAIQGALSRMLQSREGRRLAVSALLSTSQGPNFTPDVRPWRDLLAFREESISRFVGGVSDWARSRGLQVGLDCFSPALTRMVGQDIAGLVESADWIKVMTYARAFAPASLSYEIVALIRWLMSAGETEKDAILCLARATGWPLASSCADIEQDGLPPSVLTHEIERGRLAAGPTLLAGIELVEIPGVVHLTKAQIRADSEAVRAGGPGGVVLCWDLWHMSSQHIALAASLYGRDH